MKVSALLDRKGGATISANPGETLSQVAKRLAEHKIGAVLVLDPTSDGSLCGILSERDIVRALAERGPSAGEDSVSSVMTRDVITGTSGDTTEGLMQIMSERRIRHLPIVDDGNLAGMVSIGDVVKCRLEEMQMETDQLREFIAG